MASNGLYAFVTMVTVVTMVTGGDHDASVAGIQEFCVNEEFRARCGDDDVIVMEEARYGRMHQSRCVRKDYGFIGCHKDVLGIADVMCSGRHTCSIRVPNEMLDAAKTDCPEDFKSYFEARYSCVPVAGTLHGGLCRSKNPVILTQQTGTIANIVTSETTCGNAHAPWVIEVKAGQRINITLIDFGYASRNNMADHTNCYAYASVKEIKSKRSSSVCGGRTRISHVYTSIENTVQIVMFGSGPESTSKYFLLKYEALGCPDPLLKNGWFKRKGDNIDFGCDGQKDVFTSTCNGTHWDKQIHNCSVIAATKSGRHTTLGFSMSYDIAIAIILAIAIVIASIILCVGIICMRRLRGERTRHVPQQMYSDRSQYLVQNYNNDHRKDIYPPCPSSYEQYKNGENLYASIQESLPSPHFDCKIDRCTCRQELSRELPTPACGHVSGSSPYSSLEQPCAGAVAPEPISPTSRSECSSIYPETPGRPYYVLDPNDGPE